MCPMFQQEDRFLILPTNDLEIVARIEEALTQNGLRVLRTFQLRASSEPDFKRNPDNLSRLVCQMAILLVFGRMSCPVTVVIQIDRNRTTLSIARAINTSANRYLENKIIKTLTQPTNSFFQVQDIPRLTIN